ncbi:hypothetical protein Tco_0779087 [Tanacetum coccineum]
MPPRSSVLMLSLVPSHFYTYRQMVRAPVALPAGVLDLIIYSSTDSDLLKDPSAPEHAPSEPATSLFLHSSNSSKISKDSTISGSL